MAKQILSLATLREIGEGAIAATFDRELQQAVADVRGRFGDKSKRTVTLVVTVMPMERCVSEDEVTVDATSFSSVPKQRTRAYSMAITGKDQLIFRPDSPDDVNQQTLGDLESEKK